jgi:hypothetical protein
VSRHRKRPAIRRSPMATSRTADQPAPPPPEVRRGPRREPASAEGIMGAIFTTFLAYFIAEFTLVKQPHPAHWLFALFGTMIGYLGGTMVHRRRDPF